MFFKTLLLILIVSIGESKLFQPSVDDTVHLFKLFNEAARSGMFDTYAKAITDMRSSIHRVYYGPPNKLDQMLRALEKAHKILQPYSNSLAIASVPLSFLAAYAMIMDGVNKHTYFLENLPSNEVIELLKPISEHGDRLAGIVEDVLNKALNNELTNQEVVKFRNYYSLYVHNMDKLRETREQINHEKFWAITKTSFYVVGGIAITIGTVTNPLGWGLIARVSGGILALGMGGAAVKQVQFLNALLADEQRISFYLSSDSGKMVVAAVKKMADINYTVSSNERNECYGKGGDWVKDVCTFE